MEGRRTRDMAGERAAKRIKLQFADRPATPASSSNASPSDAIAGSDAANACSVVAGGVAQDTAQDAVMSGALDGRTNSLHEKGDDEERAQRQRTEKKTELDMEDVTVGNQKTSTTVTQ